MIEMIILFSCILSCFVCVLCVIRQHLCNSPPVSPEYPPPPVRSVLLVEGDSVDDARMHTAIEIAPYRNNTVHYPVYIEAVLFPESVDIANDKDIRIAVLVDRI